MTLQDPIELLKRKLMLMAGFAEAAVQRAIDAIVHPGAAGGQGWRPKMRWCSWMA